MPSFNSLPLFHRIALPSHDAVGVHEEHVRQRLHLHGRFHALLRVDRACVADVRIGDLPNTVLGFIGDADNHQLFPKLLLVVVQRGNEIHARNA